MVRTVLMSLVFSLFFFVGLGHTQDKQKTKEETLLRQGQLLVFSIDVGRLDGAHTLITLAQKEDHKRRGKEIVEKLRRDLTANNGTYAPQDLRKILFLLDRVEGKPTPKQPSAWEKRLLNIGNVGGMIANVEEEIEAEREALKKRK